ncbi:MAG: nucleotide exchange factor GrpE [Gammaproteobacteria bacterium]
MNDTSNDISNKSAKHNKQSSEKNWQQLAEQVAKEEAAEETSSTTQPSSESAEQEAETSAAQSFEKEQSPGSNESPARTSEQNAQLEAKINELTDIIARKQAELQNTRTRYEREVAKALKYVSKEVIDAVIPGLDCLESALDAANRQSSSTESENKLIEGVEMTYKIFLGALEKFGVKQLNPVGEMYDADQHEAISIQESVEHPAGTVITVVQKGYLMHDRVLRPAKVIVNK